MDDPRAPPPPRELQLPSSALVPVKRKRTPRGRPRQATIPVVVPPPAAALRIPPNARRRQILVPRHRAAAGPADTSYLMLLAHLAVSQADAEAEASSPPAPAAKKRSCPSASLPPAAKHEAKPYVPPPLLPPPPAVDHQNASSSMSTDHGDAATKPAAKKRSCPSLPPKPYAPPLLPPPAAVDHQNPSSSVSTFHGDATTKATAGDCKKAAFPQPQGNAGSSKGDQRGGGVAVASPAAGAGASSSLPQPGDDDEELEPGEIPPEKPAAGWNADSPHGSSLGQEEIMTEGEEAKITIAGEPAATGSSAHRAAPVTEMSAAEQKREREVFVGGLSRDAREEDVRAALSAAGEITQVRMIKDKAGFWNNGGYCFVAYREPAMASKAVAEFGNVKICGKPCRVAIPEGDEKTNKNAHRDPRRPSPTLAARSSYIKSRDDHHASYVVPPVVVPIQAGYYYTMYHNGNLVYLPSTGLNHGLAGPSGRSQMGQSGSCKPPGKPHRSRN